MLSFNSQVIRVAEVRWIYRGSYLGNLEVATRIDSSNSILYLRKINLFFWFPTSIRFGTTWWALFKDCVCNFTRLTIVMCHLYRVCDWKPDIVYCHTTGSVVDFYINFGLFIGREYVLVELSCQLWSPCTTTEAAWHCLRRFMQHLVFF